ncbi:MAG: glycosyltransferase [Elusimicrobiota bacterium]
MDKKPKIFHYITSLNIGGTERFLQDVIKETSRDYEHEVGYIKVLGKIGKELLESGVSVRKLDSIRKIYKHLKEIKPDLIHTHLYRANIMGRFAGKLAGIPVVSSQRSIDLWKNKLYILMDRFTAGWCNKVIANSHYACRIIENREKIPVEKIELIYTGLDSNWYVDDAEFRKTNNIGFVGRLHPHKGADLLCDFARDLKQSYPEISIKIVGEGPLENEMKEDLSSNAEIVGRVEGEELKRFYDNIDLILILSREESFPRVILEAASRGVPAVSADVGGISEFISEGETGYLFPPQDIKEAVKKLNDYFNKDDISKKIIAENVLNKSRQFSKEYMIEKMIKVYEEQLQSK